MTDGMSPEEIAEGLGMARHTLRTHTQNILTKLGVHSKTDAVVAAIRLRQDQPSRSGPSDVVTASSGRPAQGRPGRPRRVAPAQRVSRCSVCCRHQRQYFLNSMRSRSFTRFLTVL